MRPKPVNGWGCAFCSRIHYRRDFAERCCSCLQCRKRVHACDSALCAACKKKHDVAVAAAVVVEAKKRLVAARAVKVRP